MRGKLEVSIELIPKVLAKDRPAGRGRDEPNTNPVRPLLLLLLLSLSLSLSVSVSVSVSVLPLNHNSLITYPVVDRIVVQIQKLNLLIFTHGLEEGVCGHRTQQVG